jgi:hypothetical protein
MKDKEMQDDTINTELGRYLGIWHKDNKYYSVNPIGLKFIIRWGDVYSDLDEYACPKIIIDNPTECYKRILSKARAGYVQRTVINTSGWTSHCFLTYPDIAYVLGKEAKEAEKRARSPRFSLLDWMSGMDDPQIKNK